MHPFRVRRSSLLWCVFEAAVCFQVLLTLGRRGLEVVGVVPPITWFPLLRFLLQHKLWYPTGDH